LPENLFNSEWSLFFTSRDSGVREELNLKSVFDISNNDPLIFGMEDGDWIFKGTAPIKIKNEKCRIVIDEKFKIQHQNLNRIGNTIFGQSIFEIIQDTAIIDTKTQSELTIQLNQESDNSIIIHFSHKLYPASGSYNYLSDTKNVFIGFPKVLSYNKTIGFSSVYFSGTVEYLNDNNQWVLHDSSFKSFGRIRFRFMDRRGDIIGYKLLNILPQDLSVTINQQHGVINIRSQEDFEILLKREMSEIELERQNDITQLKVEKDGEYGSNSYIGLKISHKKSDFIELKVPNPNLAEVFINGENKILNNVEISSSKIHGIGIQMNNYSENNIIKRYELFLIDVIPT
jgi:hypothetical protein